MTFHIIIQKQNVDFLGNSVHVYVKSTMYAYNMICSIPLCIELQYFFSDNMTDERVRRIPANLIRLKQCFYVCSNTPAGRTTLHVPCLLRAFVFTSTRLCHVYISRQCDITQTFGSFVGFINYE